MQDFDKISSDQLYKLWKNLTIAMVTVIAMMTFSKLLPFFLSPVISIIAAAFIYTYIFDNRSRKEGSCMIVPYAMLYSLISYSFVSIISNVCYAWGFKQIPQEFIFFNSPYVPSLIMNPVCFFTFLIFWIRGRRSHVCRDCRLLNGERGERGSLGRILDAESRFQLKNLTVMFGLLSAIVWVYYLVFYVNINLNSRDWYIFTWVTIISFILDELYFISRYYNLYLDLKENNEIITPEELQSMTAKTYLRFYVICGNNIYVDPHAINPKTPYKDVIDTPFMTKRPINGINVGEVKKIIQKMVGYDGELRFFFGRKSNDISNHSLLRYFYFLDGELEDFPDIKTDGEWMDYEKIKYLYSNNPSKLADISVADTTRLATIILTEKIFDDKGYRKLKLKSYNPTFNLIDVRNSNLDFQDDKWIKISMFNSDTPFYGIKRKWKKNSDQKRKSNSWG